MEVRLVVGYLLVTLMIVAAAFLSTKFALRQRQYYYVARGRGSYKLVRGRHNKDKPLL